ncbi:putative N-acetyltransferase YhbS [Elusimicrobium posterum]|uniref:GNAT family N-acetyltransferase n=1 Tax=Elusimicrobium posterum TaxID=3116653 RepID=UPI003C733EAE
MIIRNLTAQDMQQLSFLYRTYWQEDSNIEKMTEVFEKIKDSPAYILLAAEENGELLGSVMGIVCQELYGECKPFLVVENLAVSPNARKKGVGKALMAEIEKKAKEQNCKQIILVTESDRQDAISFYPKIGFHPTANKGFKKKI